jgi:MtN3 and saliva related transmembrane protein
VVVLAPLTRSLASTIRTGPGRLTEGTPMAVSVLAASASAWGVLMGLSPVLQIRRMLRQRSSREVSLGYFAILLAGFLLWISYGIAAGNVWLVVPNSIALLVGLALVIVALRLRRRADRRARRRTDP